MRGTRYLTNAVWNIRRYECLQCINQCMHSPWLGTLIDDLQLYKGKSQLFFLKRVQKVDLFLLEEMSRRQVLANKGQSRPAFMPIPPLIGKCS